MNHQAGPESDDADGTAPERTSAGETSAGETSAGETSAGETSAEGTVAATTGGGETGAAGTSAAAEASEPARPDTGEPRVDAALTLLDRLSELPVTEHAAVFEQVHAELTAVLGQLDPESADTDG
jgi:GETHR pentapeptide repeat (5 copies)